MCIRDREKAAAFRESLRQGDQAPVLLGLHPGSVWGTKRWLPSGFAEIARRAAARGAHVLVFAGPGEEGVARDVIALSELKGNPLLHDLSCALTPVSYTHLDVYKRQAFMRSAQKRSATSCTSSLVTPL